MKTSTIAAFITMSHFLAYVFHDGDYAETLFLSSNMMMAATLICWAIEGRE